jgi:hypothetical protein
MQILQSRRHFLAGLSAGGAAGLLSPRRLLAEEGPPEVTTSAERGRARKMTYGR